MEHSEKYFFVLHVDSRSVLWQTNIASLARKDAQHSNSLMEGFTDKHQSQIIAKSHNFTIDEPQGNLCLENEKVRHYINFTLGNGGNHTGVTLKTRSCSLLEYRDDGAYFYREHFLPLGDRHQNWFGIRPNGEAIAVSLARVLLTNGQKQHGISSARRPVRLFQSERPLSDQSGFIQTDSPIPGRRPLKVVHTDGVSGTSNVNGFGSMHPVKQQNGLQPDTDSESELVPAWLVIVRTEKDFDLRCCVVDQAPEVTRLQHSSSVKSDTYLTSVQPATAAESKKAGRKGNGLMRNSVKKDQFAKTLVTMDPRTRAMLRYITHGQINPSELQLGKADPSIYDKLASMDELELLDQHKFGVLLCKADQTTEKEMYNNEHSTPAFDQFINLLGRRVALRNFTGYAAGLDTKTNTTGLETCVSEFHGFPITFLVSTMLPFHSTATEQVARKRHVGNSSVTFIFQEQGALPLEADTIVSRFQQVLIVVRRVQSTNATPHYRVAVCRANGVPPFGPVIDENHTYKHGPELAKLLLEKACNGANAALRAEKFRSMILRSRSEYLHQFANEHVWLSRITQIRDQKNSPFRSIGRKRSSTLTTSSQLFSDPDIQLTWTAENLEVKNAELDGQSSSQTALQNSSVELRGAHTKHRSKDKKSHASAKSIHATNSLDSAASLPTVRTPSIVKLTCMDLGHTFHVILQDVHSLYGHLSPSRLCNPGADKQSDNLEPLVALTLSKHWLIITKAVIQTGSNAHLILAIPTNSIFAYSFESNENIIVLYLNYGQSIRLKCPAPLRTSNTGLNVCHQIRQFLFEALPTGLLREVHELKLKCSNTQELLSANDNEGGPTTRMDDSDDLLHQRRKSYMGRRCALSDLGVHISFIRIQPDREPETTLMPYLFKIDEDSPAKRAGLRRGQIILRIGTHEIADLFRASLCIPANSDSEELMYSPFILRCPNIRFESADLLSLIRRLRFSQDILFAVGSVFNSETSLSPVRANPLINRISFPYLRSPSGKSTFITSRSKDSNMFIIDEQNKINDEITGDESKVHTPRRLSTSGSCTKATETSVPIWIEQFKLLRSPLMHQQSLPMDQLPPVNRTVTRLNSLPGESDNCKPPDLSERADPVRSPGNPRSVRWSFATLFNSEGELRKAAAASEDGRNTLTRGINTKYKAEKNVDSTEVDERMRIWDASCIARNMTTTTDNEQPDYATIQTKHPRKFPTQGRQASKLWSFLDQLGDQSARSRSNPQLNTPTDGVYSQLQPNYPDTGSLNHDRELLTIKSQVKSSPKNYLRSTRSMLSEHSFDSNGTTPVNPIAFDRRSRVDDVDSKQTIWFPMQQSRFQTDRTGSMKEEDKPQVPPRSTSRFQEKYVVVGRKQSVGSPSETHRSSLTTDCGDKTRGPKYIYITPETERKTLLNVQTEDSRRPSFNSEQTKNSKILDDPLNLQFRVQELEKQLRLEQQRRSQMATMCASLMEENRQLRSNRMPDYDGKQSTIYPQLHDAGRGRTTVDPIKSHTPISNSQTTVRNKINFLPKFKSETDI